MKSFKNVSNMRSGIVLKATTTIIAITPLPLQPLQPLHHQR